MKKKILVNGMSCGHCVSHLKTALEEDIEGVEVIDVSLEDKCAVVDMQDDISEESLRVVIEDLGFELVGIE